MMYDDRLVYEIKEKDNGRTLQSILQGSLDVSSAFIRDLKRTGGMLINGEKSRTIDKVNTGDTVTVMLNYTDMATLEGDTWFTAAVAPSIIGTDNNQLSALTTVNAIFRCNNQNYFTDAADEDNEAEAN